MNGTNSDYVTKPTNRADKEYKEICNINQTIKVFADLSHPNEDINQPNDEHKNIKDKEAPKNDLKDN